MTSYEIPESRWAIKLAPQLSGRAQDDYAVMSMATATDYKEVKKAILRRYDIRHTASGSGQLDGRTMRPTGSWLYDRML